MVGISCLRNNPFLDPPLDAALSSSSPPSAPAFTVLRSPAQAFQYVQRPRFNGTVSAVDTLSSATSMQLFGTSGGLRITNDPQNIPTPDVSHSGLLAL